MSKQEKAQSILDHTYDLMQLERINYIRNDSDRIEAKLLYAAARTEFLLSEILKVLTEEQLEAILKGVQE